ncbi:P-loop containing nucleoside triphosphate hydrolase protein [Mycotypha africana]|uniref:P-loop containing nucleoside triphosphate hydrolase protein n=1 Tax=Mycotypha africana TaxID=64632 RepID=UPI0023017A93|nr:P-loop containing nucleoside triphosphate hydrolase protein [Mycotypha africana]KAI8991707.1 P-loop containing nucleoside triphosphate hydrolase protein [Mycotypha africana]
MKSKDGTTTVQIERSATWSLFDNKNQKNAKNDSRDNSTKSKRSKRPKTPKVSMLRLFRFSTFTERILLCFATIFSIGAGALQPVSILIYGTFINNLTSNLSDPSSLLELTLPVIRIMAYMGTASLIAAYASNCLWVLTGENQTRRIRSLYLHSVLKQDMSWFDQAANESLNTRLASDTQLVQDGISEKFGLLVTLIAQFVGGFVVAFIKGWQVAVMILAVVPLLIGLGRTMVYFITKYAIRTQTAYAGAGSVAEQAFQAIRTVYAFTLQDRFSKHYSIKLEEAYKNGVRRAISMGLGFGTFMALLFFTYGLALWYGSMKVAQGELTGPQVFVAFLAMMLGSMSLIKLPSNLSAVSTACGAAYKIYEIIDRIPKIDVESTTGLVPKNINGSIEFRHVHFKYPTRPDLVILDDFNLKIEPGQTVAFVGPSGSGKSTTVQLVQRFYDTLSGQVLVDGHDVKDLSVRWLRQQIGAVSQEPVLFNMTIRQNLLMGVEGEVSEKSIIAACEEANCHTFITRLPNGYDTLVGDQGSMLSGGQKQRIAIARAILKNPTILLLDEATSALDTQSERLVQNALDKASAKRTTIVVAHRLSTIMKADLIIVLDHGIIVEKGTHQQLIELNGVYADLVRKQAINVEEAKRTSDENEYNADELLRQEELQIKQQMDDVEMQQNLSKIRTGHSYHSNMRASAEKYPRESNAKDIDAYDVQHEEKERLKKIMKKQRAPVWKVLKFMRPEWKLLAVALCGSAVAGCIFPLYSFCFSRVITILSIPGQEIQPGPLEGTNLYAFIFVMLGIVTFIGNASQLSLYEVCGERFTKRFRAKIFSAYLKQEVGFFDMEENNSGALTTRLAVDARNVTEMITKTWGDVTQLCATCICALVIAFSHSWALTLVVLCMAPFLTIATAYEFRIQRGYEDETKKANADSGQVAGEAIREVRTVAALNKQSYFEDRYYHGTDRSHSLAMKKAYLSSIAAGFGKGINIYANALAFYAGARFIQNGMIDFQQMFTSMTVIMTAAEAAGRCTTFASAFSKAKIAAIASFNVLERASKIDPDLEGFEPSAESLKGDISFKDIKFAYPARPDINIFDGEFNLHGPSGKTIALVGPSGCGKSTTIGMLERWYDPLKGNVSLDEINTQHYSLYNLRSHMALVGQEPVLFDMSISENIKFGVDDTKTVTEKEIEAACSAANIHAFISGLPEGYNTRVGNKGSQLSGGQKQRIAIARALIRKPRVLLLDEATSALDSDSERLVQEALNNILEEGGRTTITIAHRLSTIQNADLICVVKDGKVIEQGTHSELLALHGVYSELVHEQSLSVL